MSQARRRGRNPDDRTAFQQQQETPSASRSFASTDAAFAWARSFAAPFQLRKALTKAGQAVHLDIDAVGRDTDAVKRQTKQAIEHADLGKLKGKKAQDDCGHRYLRTSR